MTAQPQRRLRQSVLISVNGVISQPLAWAGPHFGPGTAERSLAMLQDSDAFLMGRRTYEIFSGQWPSAPGPYAERLNTIPKYVFSSTLQAADWNNTTIVAEDPAEAVQHLKTQPGKDLIFYGHGQFGQTLINSGLVDEVTFTIVPVVVAGTPLYRPDLTPGSWELVAAGPGADPGLASLTYRPRTGLTADAAATQGRP